MQSLQVAQAILAHLEEKGLSLKSAVGVDNNRVGRIESRADGSAILYWYAYSDPECIFWGGPWVARLALRIQGASIIAERATGCHETQRRTDLPAERIAYHHPSQAVHLLNWYLEQLPVKAGAL